MRYVAITSGKGGTGKTAFTVNFALCLAQRGKRVLIFDGDLGLANVDIQLGLQNKYNLSHVVSGEKKLADVLADGPSGIKVLPGASGIVEMETLSPEMHGRLLGGVKTLDERFDIVLVDTGAGISNTVQLLNAAADEVVLVLTPDPSALMDAYAMVKLLATRCGQQLLRVVVNQVSSLDEANDVFERLRKVTKQFLATQLELLGPIGFDIELQSAMRQQNAKPVVITKPNATSSSDMRTITNKWLALPAVTNTRDSSSFWERVLNQNLLKPV